MVAPLLTTKLNLPVRREDIVHRARLLERLNDGLRQPEGFVRKLTLVSTAAGFGKTTLVAEWLHSLRSSSGAEPESGVRVAWLSLEDEDNDPVRFLSYLIAALRAFQMGFGERTAAILHLPQPPPPAVISTSLVNELAAFPLPFILALDDYHAIHSTSIHQQLAFILEHQPAHMHLVILTREDPLLPLARLRARGQLLELRQDDLRFTLDETAEFLRHRMGLPLGPDEVAALEHHTEGWIAGLQLAALSMRGHDNLPAFIRDFTVSDRYILDYLVEEVFERQPAELQDFLLRTSILKRLTGPLCDVVTGRSGGSDVLRSLEGANLFLVPLDPSRIWYRYHHLFSELLRHRLRLSAVQPEELHRRASGWYEAEGLLPEATEHALLAQDWGAAARLIGALNQGMLKRGETVTLLGWCGRLPQEVTYSSIELCLVYGWAALLASRLDIAAPLLDRAEQLAPPGSPLLGQVASAQAFLARARRDNVLAVEKSEQALALLPEADIADRGNIAMTLGLAYWHDGRISEAEQILLQAQDLCIRAENTFALLTSQVFLARIPAVRGRLRQAAALSEKLIEVGGQVPILCLAHYDLATIHHEWNDLPQAMEHYARGFALSQRSGNLEFQQAGHLLRAILAWAQGDESGAMAALTEAYELAKEFPAAVRSRAAALGVQWALARDDAQMLAHWAERVNAEVDAHSFYRFLGLTASRLLIAQGKKQQAADALARLGEAASRTDWGYGLLAIRILQALAARTSSEAMPFIAEALRFGQPQGFLRSFVDAGGALVPVLEEAARRGVEPEYAGRILSAFGVVQLQQSRNLAVLPEPLSQRELEVLRLVMAGLSNREIAAMLVISTGTAKTHVHNLCSKLGVRNRTEAAMRAKELDLV